MRIKIGSRVCDIRYPCDAGVVLDIDREAQCALVSFKLHPRGFGVWLALACLVAR